MFVIPDAAVVSFCGCSGRAQEAKLRLLRQYGSARANQRAGKLAARLSDRAGPCRSARLDLGVHELLPFATEPAAAASANSSDRPSAPSRGLFY
jgi:hypothetical protein